MERVKHRSLHCEKCIFYANGEGTVWVANGEGTVWVGKMLHKGKT
jgi:hypothetical protein